jgi:hypothetical protein
MSQQLRIASAQLAVDGDLLPAMSAFYLEQLGFGGERRGDAGLGVQVGDAQLRFASVPPGAGPFYHVALLVPGDRFEAARAWLADQVGLLTRPGDAETTFVFDFWDAEACYVHDPAGNIVELIAHHGVAETSATGSFRAGELVAISEVGVVTIDLDAAEERLRAAGLLLWSGSLEGEGALGFVGRKAHTLILCAPSRPWLPTMRPAELHPVVVTLDGVAGGVVTVRGEAGAVTADRA